MLSAPWLDRVGCTLLRWSLAVIFLWFGLLKLANLCPLADFICRTVPWVPPGSFLVLLGGWEAAIGICLLRRRWAPLGLLLLFLHLPGTALPLLFLPDECFLRFPYALTLEGQYIVKNLILASAALVVFTGSRRPVPYPEAADAG